MISTFTRRYRSEWWAASYFQEFSVWLADVKSRTPWCDVPLTLMYSDISDNSLPNSSQLINVHVILGSSATCQDWSLGCIISSPDQKVIVEWFWRAVFFTQGENALLFMCLAKSEQDMKRAVNYNSVIPFDARAQAERFFFFLNLTWLNIQCVCL